MVDTLPRHYIISIIVFTMVIMAGVGFISEFFSGATDKIDSNQFHSFNRTFNQFEELQNQTGKLKLAAENADQDAEKGGLVGAWGFLDSLVRSAWATLKSIFSSFSFMTDLFSNLGPALGIPIPSWVGALIVMLITVILVFAIFSAIFQREV